MLELVEAFEAASGRSLKTKIAARRFGDVAQCDAPPSKAKARLGWKAQ